MRSSRKIAIYSGEIPSTTFIERLIVGLSNTEHHIYLFGPITRNISYSNAVKVVGYTHSKYRKLTHFLKYSLLLLLFKPDDKRKLDRILRHQSKNILYSKVKSYPVLWHRPDIFHLQWAKGLEEWAWVQEFGIKLVLSLRGAHINYSPIANPELARMYRIYFPKVDGFHAVSKAIAKEASIYGAVSNKIKLVYSGLDLNYFKLDSNVKNEVFNIISVGRPHWKKGYHYALDTCKILKDVNFKFKYTIIGGAKDIELLYQQTDLKLEDVVVLTGQQSFDEIKSLVNASDLFLLPSVEEGIANVVLESMALNTLVLTTNCGGMDEVITDGVNGFIVPIRDSKAMAERILFISDLSEKRKSEIKGNAFKTLKMHHTERHMVQGMLELFEQIQFGL